jgi:hypothetical protein
MSNRCDCGRSDDWHYAKCRSLDGAVVTPAREGNDWIYQNDHQPTKEET